MKPIAYWVEALERALLLDGYEPSEVVRAILARLVDEVQTDARELDDVTDEPNG